MALKEEEEEDVDGAVVVVGGKELWWNAVWFSSGVVGVVVDWG